jgi:hypothetical protein
MYGMSDLGLQQQPVPARPKRRRRSIWTWIVFFILVTIVTTMSVGLTVYHTGFLSLPIFAQVFCDPDMQIGFLLTEYPNPQTGLTVVDKQLVCFTKDRQFFTGVGYAVLVVWLTGALMWSVVFEMLLRWRRRWELRKVEEEARAHGLL